MKHPNIESSTIDLLRLMRSAEARGIRSVVDCPGKILSQVIKLLSEVEMICVSSVEGGALLVTRNGSFFGRAPKISIHSSVGAGDSMVGAMIAQLYKGSVSVRLKFKDYTRELMYRKFEVL